MSPAEKLADLARTGYEAYAGCTGGKTFDGRDMPKWEDLPERIKTAWVGAASAIAMQWDEAEIPEPTEVP